MSVSLSMVFAATEIYFGIFEETSGHRVGISRRSASTLFVRFWKAC